MVTGPNMLTEGVSKSGSGTAVLKFTVPAVKYDWSYDYGKRCGQWDAALQPDCANADGTPLANPASWCADNFCYVDADNCDKSPTASSVFPGAEGVYFSTATCNDPTQTMQQAKDEKKGFMIATIILAVLFVAAATMYITKPTGQAPAAETGTVSAKDVEVELQA
jgi:hypothetical protein